MIELVRDLRVINVLGKFENDPWKSMDVRVLTGLVCPAARPPARPPDHPPARPLRVRQYPGALKGCGVKKRNTKKWWHQVGWFDIVDAATLQQFTKHTNYLASSLTQIEPHTVIKKQPKESKEKI